MPAVLTSWFPGSCFGQLTSDFHSHVEFIVLDEYLYNKKFAELSKLTCVTRLRSYNFVNVKQNVRMLLRELREVSLCSRKKNKGSDDKHRMKNFLTKFTQTHLSSSSSSRNSVSQAICSPRAVFQSFVLQKGSSSFTPDKQSCLVNFVAFVVRTRRAHTNKILSFMPTSQVLSKGVRVPEESGRPSDYLFLNCGRLTVNQRVTRSVQIEVSNVADDCLPDGTRSSLKRRNVPVLKIIFRREQRRNETTFKSLFQIKFGLQSTLSNYHSVSAVVTPDHCQEAALGGRWGGGHSQKNVGGSPLIND